ncbi:MAG: response regulator transcription factor [Anaerolineae bacterium]|nr:response regulator transcription factor [Anaerolineae bacterium]
MARLPERPPQQIELALFRAVQDALDRATRSARAARATIRLSVEDGTLNLTYHDDGQASVGAEALRAARGRIEQLGGSVQTGLGEWGGLLLTIRFALAPPVEFTPRELEVLQLLAEGMSNKEIAAVLVISPRTVNFHLDNIYSKLGVSSRTEAAIYALRNGLVRRGPGEF